MTEEPDKTRFFNEKEISFIIKRATELQHIKQKEYTPVSLNESDLSKIAEDSGIQQEYISAAITELEIKSAEISTNFWGGPLSLTLDRTINGQLDEKIWEELLSEIRKTFKDSGHVSKRDHVWEWTRSQQKYGVQQTYVSATTAGDKTHIQIVWNESIAAVPIYVIAGSLGLISIPIIFESLGMVSPTGLMLFLTSIAVLFSVARFTVKRTAIKKKKVVRQLMGRLDRILFKNTEESEKKISDTISINDSSPLIEMDEVKQNDLNIRHRPLDKTKSDKTR